MGFWGFWGVVLDVSENRISCEGLNSGTAMVAFRKNRWVPFVGLLDLCRLAVYWEASLLTVCWFTVFRRKGFFEKKIFNSIVSVFFP